MSRAVGFLSWDLVDEPIRPVGGKRCYFGGDALKPSDGLTKAESKKLSVLVSVSKLIAEFFRAGEVFVTFFTWG